MIIKAIIFLIIILNVIPVWGATRLVTTGGGASGDCTSTPCSPQYAINQAQAGDTVSFADGTYSMTTDLVTVRSGGTFSTPSWPSYPTNPSTTAIDGACSSVISIKSANKWGAILNAANEVGITVEHNCIEVDGLKMTGTPSGYGFIVLGNSNTIQGVRIKNIYIDNESIAVDRYVTRANDVSYSYIKDCYFYRTWYAVFTNTGSLAHHFIYEGNEVNGANMDIFRPFGHDILYKDNIIHEVTDTQELHCDFIQSFGNSNNFAYNIIFDGNLMYNGLGATVAIGQVSREEINTDDIRDWTFRNNVFANIRGIWGGDALRQKWYNNTFYRVPDPSGSITDPIRLGCSGGTSGDSWCANDSEIKNNLFVACASNSDASGWYNINGGGTVTGLSADYNMVTNDDNTAKSGFTGVETHGVSGGNPQFVSKTDPYNFMIGSTSGAKDKGVTIATFSLDKLGNTRSGTWDIGAYEYTDGGGSETGNINPGITIPGGVTIR